MPGEITFSSESVTEGHPDKIADQISDAVLDAVLGDDPAGRVACETLITTGLIVVAGEITTTCYVDIPRLARSVVRDIGYTRAKYGFDADTCSVVVALDEQSPDIAQGVDDSYDGLHEGADAHLARQGAGDQGMMFGYASDETEELMPLPIVLAHRLTRRLAEVRKDGTLPYLRPDGKAQVTVRYQRGADGALEPLGVERVLISTQHAPGLDAKRDIRPDLLEQVVVPSLPPELVDLASLRDTDAFLVNPTGKLRDRRADGRHGPDGAQDHRRHLRRLGPPRRRRFLAARTPRRSTAPPPTRRAGWPRTSWRPGSRAAASCRSRTRSASRSP